MSRQLRSTTTLLAVSLAIPILALVLAACGSDSSSTASSADPPAQAAQPVPDGAKTIYLAGGCFWGLEKYVGLVQGVAEHRGRLRERHQRQRDVRRRQRLRRGGQDRLRPQGRAAPVPARPVLRRHRSDVGEPAGQRRRRRVPHGIYYTDPADEAVIEESLAELQKRYSAPIAIEVGPLVRYTPAEEYHQDYLDKNPGGYCHIPRKLFDAAAAARPK